jgi:hypothetical protein
MVTRNRTKLQPLRHPAFLFRKDPSSSVKNQHVRENWIYGTLNGMVEDNFSMKDVTNIDLLGECPRVTVDF